MKEYINDYDESLVTMATLQNLELYFHYIAELKEAVFTHKTITLVDFVVHKQKEEKFQMLGSTIKEVTSTLTQIK
eukprot:Awhi_evm1s5578